MAGREPIHISSSDSDSDWDLDEYKAALMESPPRQSVASINHMALPSSTDTPGTSSMAYSVLSQKTPSQASASNGSLSNKYSTRQDSGPHSSGQGYKRTFQPPVPSSRSTNSVENVGSSQMRETYGKSVSAQSKLMYDTNYMKNQSGRNRDMDDDVIMYERNGSRIRPLPLMHTKSASTAEHASSADPVYRPGPGVGDERVGPVGEYDERLIFQAALQDLNQPKFEATLPDGLLSVSLLRHQKIALAWMLQKETRSTHCAGGILADDQGLGKTISMIALIQMQKLMQLKSKPEALSHQTAEDALNLDDDEENDTTTPVEKGKQDGESNDVKLIPEASTSKKEIHTRRPQAGTLVVCPASVLRQWERELEEKVADEAKLSVLVYHGSNRTRDPIELSDYDVVLTTYAIVQIEVPKQPLGEEDDPDQKNDERRVFSSKLKKTSNPSKKRKKGNKGIDIPDLDLEGGTIAKVRWSRVILDEAQIIKNHRTQVARACCSLKAKTRWCLSGTPIQNAVDDLFSYFKFLRYEPYTTYKSFCSTIKFPISKNAIHGYKKVYVVLKAVMLRRTKGTFIDGEPIIKLPPKTIGLTQVDFSAEERAFYKKLEADSRSQFKAYAAAGTVGQNYANILLLLLRLRQACDHPLLVKGFSSESVGRDSMRMAKGLPRDMLINLLKCLEASEAICVQCKDSPEDAIVTMCGHVFCYQCVSEYLRGDDNTCPARKCRGELGPDVIFSGDTLRSCISDDDLDDNLSSSYEPKKSKLLQNEYSSSKIRSCLEILQAHCKPDSEMVRGNGNDADTMICTDMENEGPRKAIVFSQWTGMLDLVEISLNQTGLRYRKLDGSMTLSARDRAVKEFNNDPEVTVMLMSLKAGNLGLNMVAASHVVLLDLWWNPTTEEQAIDRAHRIGQTRPVTVTRLTIKDTVEDRILSLQEDKRKMVASAFGEDQSGGSGTRLTPEDLKYLFMGNM